MPLDVACTMSDLNQEEGKLVAVSGALVRDKLKHGYSGTGTRDTC